MNISEKKKVLVRGEIIKAARILFSEKGYHNTQIIDIVKAVGMSAGTFYNYFSDKRELLEHIIKTSFEELKVILKNVRKNTNMWDKNERKMRSLATVTTYFDYIDREQQQFLFLLRGGYGVDSDFDGNVWNYYSGIAKDLAQDYADWIKEGIFKKTNAYLLACTMVGMVMNIGHSYVMEKKFTREQAIKVITTSIVAIFDAFETEAAKQYMSELSKPVIRKGQKKKS
jgi:AcrR family transcriptional regulator